MVIRCSRDPRLPMQPSMQAVKVAGQKIAQLATANAELRVANRQLKVQVALWACACLSSVLACFSSFHSCWAASSSCHVCLHQADSAFRLQDMLPDAAYGIAVISDCSTIKASCMLTLSLQSCICVSEVAATRSMLILTEHTLHWQLLLKAADARMEP